MTNRGPSDALVQVLSTVSAKKDAVFERPTSKLCVSMFLGGRDGLTTSFAGASPSFFERGVLILSRRPAPAIQPLPLPELELLDTGVTGRD